MTRSTATLALLIPSIVCSREVGLSQEAETKDGRVTEVTLFRGQAQIVRTLEIDGATGSREIVVSNLPAKVVPDSVFAEGSNGLEVRAVRYRSRAVSEEPREEVRAIDTQILKITDDKELTEQRLALVAKQLSYLDSLEGFVSPTAKSELSRGVLNPESLQSITKFSFEQRRLAMEEEMTLKKGLREVTKELTVLQRRRAEVARDSTRVLQEAVLFLEKTAPGKESVRLTYLVGNCGWQPNYNIRANSKNGSVRLEYNALITQLSGEDWTNVDLTLSTATPALSAAGPGLAAFHLVLAPVAKKRQTKSVVPSQIKSIRGRLQQAQFDNRNAVSLGANMQSSWTINDVANELQVLELTCSSTTLNKMLRDVSTPDEGPSLNYHLGNEVSLRSRSDQQMIRILGADLVAGMYYVASPVLSNHVYREAAVTNTSREDLLGGPVSVYLDRRFVGRSEISTVARGQTFVVGFGIDPQLRTSRELLDRTQDIQGGNSVITFKHRLFIESFKDQPVKLRLQDRLPNAEPPSDIQVTLGDLSDPLSKDAMYIRLDRSKGILRWDLVVEPGTAAEKARMVEYSYTLEHDRNLMLGAPSAGLQQQIYQEFQDLQRRRSKF